MVEYSAYSWSSPLKIFCQGILKHMHGPMVHISTSLSNTIASTQFFNLIKMQILFYVMFWTDGH